MSTATLSKVLKEAQGLTDDSNGGVSSLYEVLAALAAGGGGDLSVPLIASPSVAVVATKPVARATRLGALAVTLSTTGTANSTDVDVLVDGVVVASASVDNTDADGVVDLSVLDVEVPAGSLVTISVTAVATGAAGLAATLSFEPVKVAS